MAIPLSYSARSLWTRRATTLATAAGIALVVFVLAASRMLSEGMRGTMLRAGSETRALVMLHDSYAERDSRIRQTMLTSAAGAPGVRRGADGQPLATGESVTQIFVPRLDDPGRISGVQVRGVSENVLLVRPEVRVVQGRLPELAHDEGMIGAALIGNYPDLQLGGRFALKKGRDIRIVGVFEAQGSAYESEIWTGLDVVRTSMGWDGFLSAVTVELESRAAFDGFASALEADKSFGVAAVPERAYYEKVSQGLARSVTTLGDLVTLIFGCGAMLGAAITMNEAIARRRKEIGVLRALGFSAPEVMLVFVLEAAGVALFGALIGAGLAALLGFVRFSITNYGTGNEIAFPFEPHPSILLWSILAGAVVGVLGGLVPALKAARTSPVAAMRV
jgi:ABC-type lipoprotein release transport system permease subunit